MTESLIVLLQHDHVAASPQQSRTTKPHIYLGEYSSASTRARHEKLYDFSIDARTSLTLTFHSMAKRATLHPVFSHSRSHPMKRPKKAPKVWPQRTNHGVPPTIPTGYLNSGNLIFDDSSGETEEESEEEIEPGPISKKVKRATAKGCFQGDIPAPRLSPVHSPVTSRDATPLLEDDTLVEGNEFDLPLSTTVPVQLKPIQLSFTIPKNHKGPFQVTIDLNSLTIPVGTNITSVTRQDYTPARLSHGIYESIEMPVTPSTNTVSTNATIAVEDITTKVGFATLPAELRNRVYRMVFKGDLVCLGHRSNMSRSAALLATCKLILREGRTILYGENVFHFRRETKPRGKFYHERWTEVAYQVSIFFELPIHPVEAKISRICSVFLKGSAPSISPCSVTSESASMTLLPARLPTLQFTFADMSTTCICAILSSYSPSTHSSTISSLSF